MKTSLREIKLEDADIIYAWQQKKETRQYFFNDMAPNFSEHLSWMKRVISDCNTYLLMIEEDSDSCGVIKLDIDGVRAEINIYVDPLKHNNGIGSRALALVSNWFDLKKISVNKITAKVKPENAASISLFKKLGFSEHYILLEKDVAI